MLPEGSYLFIVGPKSSTVPLNNSVLSHYLRFDVVVSFMWISFIDSLLPDFFNFLFLLVFCGEVGLILLPEGGGDP
jgi:hypothetical protein